MEINMREQSHRINGALTLLIYGSFALFSLLLVVVGARVYRNIVSIGQENANVRAAFSYVTGKVHMSTGAAGTPSLRNEGDIEVLILGMSTEGYETRIFYYDGALRELYQAADQDFFPEMGEKIVEVQDFHMEFTEEGNLVLWAVDSKGHERSLHLYIEGEAYE